MSTPGRLCVCATPIGNLGDVTLRVLETLRAADAIAAEDTRVTRRLLTRYEVKTPLERYDAHVGAQRTPELVARMQAGETIALVSDAGTPGVSDPGALLVDACIAAGIRVEVLPGASAIVVALVASGLPTHAFYFGGFLPRKAGERASALDKLAQLDATLIFYESPRRAARTLESLAAAFPLRACALARELTKVHEEVIRGSTAEVAAQVSRRPELKGEVVLLVGPPSPGEARPVDVEQLRRLLKELGAEGMSVRDAVRRASEETGVARNVVYDIAHGTASEESRLT